jgi:hypothetical protein
MVHCTWLNVDILAVLVVSLRVTLIQAGLIR